MTKQQMTWTEFIDIFNKKHNPNYYYGKEKKKTKHKRKNNKRYPVYKVQS